MSDEMKMPPALTEPGRTWANRFWSRFTACGWDTNAATVLANHAADVVLYHEPADNGWIACSERMPGAYGDVLAWSPEWHGPIIVYRHMGGNPWLDPETTAPLHPRLWPTHWRPLPPPPPKEGSK